METTSQPLNDTVKSMFADLGIDAGHTSLSLQTLSAADSKYLRDLKLNIAAVMKGKNINPKECAMLALATAVNEKNDALIKAFEAQCTQHGCNAEELAEVHACASLLSLNNVFYRFRHYMKGTDYYNNTPAGIRMSVMMAPVVGKEFFELMSLAVSALNGCEQCVTSHEHSIISLGTSQARVYDAVRLAAVIKSLCVLA